MKGRPPAKIDVVLRGQIVSLRKSSSLTVAEIAERLGLHTASEIEAVRAVCDSLPRRYGFGEVSPRPPVTRKFGGR